MHDANAREFAPRRGASLEELHVIPRGFVRIDGELITHVGAGDPPRALAAESVTDARGRVILPGFVDCHTHACYEGDRLDEWAMKLAGKSYLEILASGGGIMSTVRAVRSSSTAALTDGLLRRLCQMAAYGTTCVEVKSGYGLDPKTELRMLDAIAAAAKRTPIRVCPTFLGAHAVDSDLNNAVETMIADGLSMALKSYPGIPVDAFCEQGAWSLDECLRYFRRAKSMGSPIRVHTDQFHSRGMIPAAVELGAVSVDHLEAATDSDLDLLARSNTIGVALPVASYCLGMEHMKAKQFIDSGGAIALATNVNPGSAPTRSMPVVIALAVREMHMTPAQAINASVWNSACVLGVADRCGSIAPGKSADLALWPCTDERAIGYELSGALPDQVLARGEMVSTAHGALR